MSVSFGFQVGNPETTIYTEFLNHTSDAVGGDERGYLPSRMMLRRGTAQNTPFEEVSSLVGSGFLFAVETFARLVRGTERQSLVSHAARASLDIAATVDAIYESVRSEQPVGVCGTR